MKSLKQQEQATSYLLYKESEKKSEKSEKESEKSEKESEKLSEKSEKESEKVGTNPS